MSTHIDDRAAGLAALPVADPERVAAYAHANSCARCKDALDEAEQVIFLLAAAPSDGGPSPRALERAWAAVAAEMDADRAALPARPRVVPVRSLLAALVAIASSALLVEIDTVGHALAWRVGIECLVLELVAGAAPLALFRFVMPSQRGVLVYGALGAWGALAGQVYLRLHCPVAHEGAHLVLFHFGGVLLATALASMLGVIRTRRV